MSHSPTFPSAARTSSGISDGFCIWANVGILIDRSRAAATAD